MKRPWKRVSNTVIATGMLYWYQAEGFRISTKSGETLHFLYGSQLSYGVWEEPNEYPVQTPLKKTAVTLPSNIKYE
jgi:hypothetical protein